MRIDGSHVSIALAGTGFLACLASVIALASPQARWSPLSGLAPAREARAYSLSAPADATPETLMQAALETRASLREAPANATAWLRLAYLDSRDAGGLGPDGNQALARSWAVAPFGPDDTAWRLTFAFNHWAALSPSNRRAALDELRVTQGRAGTQRLPETVRDPTGRLALLLSLDQMAWARREQTQPKG